MRRNCSARAGSGLAIMTSASFSLAVFFSAPSCRFATNGVNTASASAKRDRPCSAIAWYVLRVVGKARLRELPTTHEGEAACVFAVSDRLHATREARVRILRRSTRSPGCGNEPILCDIFGKRRVIGGNQRARSRWDERGDFDRLLRNEIGNRPADQDDQNNSELLHSRDERATPPRGVHSAAA